MRRGVSSHKLYTREGSATLPTSSHPCSANLVEGGSATLMYDGDQLSCWLHELPRLPLPTSVLQSALAARAHPFTLDQQQCDQGNLIRRGRIAEHGALPYRYPEQDRQRRVSDQRPAHHPSISREPRMGQVQRRHQCQVAETVEDEHRVGEQKRQVHEGCYQCEHHHTDPYRNVHYRVWCS